MREKPTLSQQQRHVAVALKEPISSLGTGTWAAIYIGG